MKSNLSIFLGLSMAALVLVPALGRADDSPKLSPERLQMVDSLGYFTPAFKQATHEYVFTKTSLKETMDEQAKLVHQLPELQKQAAADQAKVVALRQELAKYEHPEENDFTLLQARMNDSGAKLEDQLTFAQAYVWTYPSSPHESDAQQYLQKVQQKLADQQKAANDAEAARVAAHAALVKRAQAHDLSLTEWRDFLRGMSQGDLIELLGRPSSQTGGYWIYTGEWTQNPVTKNKVGLQIGFDAARVQSVDEKPANP